MAAFLRLPPAVRRVLGMKLWASIISTIGPSFLIFGPFLATSTYLGFWRGLDPRRTMSEKSWGPEIQVHVYALQILDARASGDWVK